ncbi:hypothetical protein JHK87_019548 [Glycine soja]|nr:hypothetical protein JHK87_019548 [Glycine soja]
MANLFLNGLTGSLVYFETPVSSWYFGYILYWVLRQMAMVKVTIKNVDSAIVLVHICASQTPLAKIPDIEKCLDVVATLQAKRGTGEGNVCGRGGHSWLKQYPSKLGRTGAALTADFEVSEEKYSQARIEETDSVCLWLGAIVMSEYSLEEATDLLQKNLDNV